MFPSVSNCFCLIQYVPSDYTTVLLGFDPLIGQVWSDYATVYCKASVLPIS